MTIQPLILITGAAGKTGAATVHALASNPDVRVRAMVRRDDKRADALRKVGAEVVVGDLNDIRALRSAMRGVQRAYFVAGFSTNSLDQALNFAVAAAESRLEHVVALGQWLSSPCHPSVATRRTWLIDQFFTWIPNVTHTIINVGWFADNTMPLLGVAAQLGIFPFPLGAGSNAPISNEDIGRVVAAILCDPSAYVARTLRPTGPELLSPSDIAQIYGREVGRTVRYQDISPKMFGKALKALDLVSPLLQSQLIHYVRDYQDGAFAQGGVTNVVEQVTGRESEDFATITRRYVTADPLTKPGFVNKLRAFAQMLKIAMTPAPNAAKIEREARWPLLQEAEYACSSEVWTASHGGVAMVSPDSAPGRKGERPFSHHQAL